MNTDFLKILARERIIGSLKRTRIRFVNGRNTFVFMEMVSFEMRVITTALQFLPWNVHNVRMI